MNLDPINRTSLIEQLITLRNKRQIVMDEIKTTQTKKIQVNNEINAVFNDLKKMLNNIESEVFKVLGQI